VNTQTFDSAWAREHLKKAIEIFTDCSADGWVKRTEKVGAVVTLGGLWSPRTGLANSSRKGSGLLPKRDFWLLLGNHHELQWSKSLISLKPDFHKMWCFGRF